MPRGACSQEEHAIRVSGSATATQSGQSPGVALDRAIVLRLGADLGEPRRINNNRAASRSVHSVAVSFVPLRSPGTECCRPSVGRPRRVARWRRGWGPVACSFRVSPLSVTQGETRAPKRHQPRTRTRHAREDHTTHEWRQRRNGHSSAWSGPEGSPGGPQLDPASCLSGSAYRSGLKVARNSSEKSSGSSQAAK